MAGRVTKTATAVAENMYELGSGSTYTKVGSLTDNRGVFSGFSSANRVDTNGSISANSTLLEVFGSYQTLSDVASEQYIICTNTRNFAVAIKDSKFRLQVSSNGGSGWNYLPVGSTTLTANTKYYFRCVSDNTNLRLYLYDGANYTLQATIAINSGTFTSGATLSFGNHTPTGVCPALGYIDIKDFSIKVNGKLTWSGLDAYMVNNKAKIGKYYIGASELYEV